MDAWRLAGPPAGCELVLVGPNAGDAGSAAAGATDAASGGQRSERPIECSIHAWALAAEQLREVYAHADVLVVPSIPTASFREPWGLVVNEAMNRGMAVIASDAVGAAAGGLVRDGDTGIVVPAGDPRALAGCDRAPGRLERAAGAARSRRREGRRRLHLRRLGGRLRACPAERRGGNPVSFGACGFRPVPQPGPAGSVGLVG